MKKGKKSGGFGAINKTGAITIFFLGLLGFILAFLSSFFLRIWLPVWQLLGIASFFQVHWLVSYLAAWLFTYLTALGIGWLFTLKGRFLGEKVLSKIPYLRWVWLIISYSQEGFSSLEKEGKVVMIKNPLSGHWVLAGATRKIHPTHQGKEKVFYAVMILFCPNPLTGVPFLVPEEEVIETDLEGGQFFLLIATFFIIGPKRFNLKHISEKMLKEWDKVNGVDKTKKETKTKKENETKNVDL